MHHHDAWGNFGVSIWCSRAFAVRGAAVFGRAVDARAKSVQPSSARQQAETL